MRAAPSVRPPYHVPRQQTLVSADGWRDNHPRMRPCCGSATGSGKGNMPRGVIFAMETSVPNLVLIGRSTTEAFMGRMDELEREGSKGAVSLKRRYAVEVEDSEGAMLLIQDLFVSSHVPTSDLYTLDVELLVRYLASLAGRRVFPPAQQQELPTSTPRKESPKTGPAATPKGSVAQKPGRAEEKTPTPPKKPRNVPIPRQTARKVILYPPSKPADAATPDRRSGSPAAARTAAPAAGKPKHREARPKVIGLPKPPGANPKLAKKVQVGNRQLSRALKRHRATKGGSDIRYGTFDDEGNLRISESYSDYLKILQWAALYGDEQVRTRSVKLLTAVQRDLERKFDGVTELVPETDRQQERSIAGNEPATRLDEERIAAMFERRKGSGQERAYQEALGIAHEATKVVSPFRQVRHTYEVRTPDGKFFGSYTKAEFDFLFKGKPRFKGQGTKKYWEVQFEDVEHIVQGAGCRYVQADDGTFATWSEDQLAEWTQSWERQRNRPRGRRP